MARNRFLMAQAGQRLLQSKLELLVGGGSRRPSLALSILTGGAPEPETDGAADVETGVQDQVQAGAPEAPHTLVEPAVVDSRPAVDSQPVAEAQPVVGEAQPVTEAQPVVEARPVVEPRVMVEPGSVVEPQPMVGQAQPVVEARPVVVRPRSVVEPRAAGRRRYERRTVYLSDRDLRDLEAIAAAWGGASPGRLTRSAVLRRAIKYLRAEVDAGAYRRESVRPRADADAGPKPTTLTSEEHPHA